jgi:hypothetical protein
MFLMQPIFEKYDFLYCNLESGGGDACFGTAAVLRMSFILFLFHAFMLLTLLPRSICSSLFHQGCWLLKFLMVIGGYIGVFWIPNKFYYGWAHFARIASGVFLVLQIVMIVVAALKGNSNLVKRYEESGSCCAMFVLIGTSMILTCGTIAFYVYQYIWFS